MDWLCRRRRTPRVSESGSQERVVLVGMETWRRWRPRLAFGRVAPLAMAPGSVGRKGGTVLRGKGLRWAQQRQAWDPNRGQADDAWEAKAKCMERSFGAYPTRSLVGLVPEAKLDLLVEYSISITGPRTWSILEEWRRMKNDERRWIETSSPDTESLVVCMSILYE